MKSRILVLIIFCMIITGCSNSLTCSKKEEKNGYKLNTKVSITANNKGKVESSVMTVTMIFDDKKDALDYFEIFKMSLNDNDTELKLEDNKVILIGKTDLSKLELDKNEYGNTLRQEGYSCK